MALFYKFGVHMDKGEVLCKLDAFIGKLFINQIIWVDTSFLVLSDYFTIH